MTRAMRTLDYQTLDVFTDRIFGGNPLAVVMDSPDLDDATFRAVTREFNYSETVFVLPPRGGGHRRVRIFTPGRELPFAGHPTVGTALLLAELGIGDPDRVVLEEGVGNVPVRIVREGGRPAFAELTVPRPAEYGPPTPPPEAIAAVVSLDPADLAEGPGALGAASCGVPFVLARVKDVEALGRARGDVAAWRRVLADYWAIEIYVWCEAGDGTIRARMFAPAMGIPEDPATGAAAAALAAWLGRQPGTPEGEGHRMIHQGVELGRPSALRIAWRKSGNAVSDIRVGGTAVRVASGSMRIGAT